jgi:hypothetical protein
LAAVSAITLLALLPSVPPESMIVAPTWTVARVPATVGSSPVLR